MASSPPTPAPTPGVALRRLVLVGGGRAHLHVLRELARRPIANVETVLVVSGDHYHAPMVPGYLQGQYEADQLRFDLTSLARRAGARLVHAIPERVDPARRVVIASGDAIPFDVCSLDLERESTGADIPGVAEHALTLHPRTRAVKLRARLDALAAGASHPPSVVVVGGGKEGVEVALAVRERLRSAAAGGVVSLVEQGTEILPGVEPSLQQLATRALRERGVSLALGGRVTEAGASAVTLHNGAAIPADLVVWAAGAAAPTLIARSGLPHDADGYLLVDRSMRAVDGAPVWGAGECITHRDFPELAKEAAQALREAPALDRSLRAALGKGRAARFRPKRRRLELLNAGGGWALMRWKGIYRHSRWAWRLKNLIDRRFMRRYRVGDEKRRPAG